MKKWLSSKYLLRVWVPGGSLFVLGGCGLSDAQLASIMQSVITTGLSAIVSSGVSAVVQLLTGAAQTTT